MLIIDEIKNFNLKKKKIIDTDNIKYDYIAILHFNDKRLVDYLFDTNTLISCLIDKNTYLKSLYQSYNNEITIQNQFILDISRSTLYINNNLVKFPIQALNYLKFTYPKNLDFVVLCNQSTCAIIFEWINNCLPDNYYLAEINDKNMTTKSIIYINNTEFIYKKNLRIFKLVNGEDVNVIYIQIKIKIHSLVGFLEILPFI